MIKRYLIGTFLLSCMLVYSQDNKGKFMIQGSAGYYNSSILYKYGIFSDKYKNNFALANVNFGYFLSTNFAVGISGSVIYSKSVGIPDPHVNLLESVNTRSQNGVGIFARYNHMLHTNKFGFFLQLNPNYYWIKETDALTISNSNGNAPDSKRTTKGMRIHTSLNPGLIYFINNKFSIESTLGSLYFSHEKLKSPDISKKIRHTSAGADFSLKQINLGFIYYF